MRYGPVLLAALWLLPGAALAQSAPDDVLSGQSPAPVPKPADVPAADMNSAPPDDEPPPKPLPTPTPAPAEPSWQPRQSALLEALDKVDGQSSTISVPVGSKQVYRNITIDVRSCYARPPDQAQDATAYLIIQDNSATTPNFVGWMLAAEPAASMMEHPVYDVRVLGCR